jgi:hypothetical protein
MIVYGTRKYGFCDSIPGMGHVVTQFAHIWFLPLIPLKSFFVFEEDDDRGIEIPMRGKSVLSAWVRTGLLFGGIGSLVAGGVMMGSNVLSGMALLMAAVASFAAFYFCGRLFGKMSDERRAQLLTDTGLGEALMHAMLEQMDEEDPAPADAQPSYDAQPYAQPAHGGQASHAPQPFAEYAPAAAPGYAQQ